MAIPKYDEMYRELLEILADLQVHRSGEIRNQIASKFHVSDAERRELLPSGRQAVFHNRVGWGCTYLKKAGLIESPARGAFRLTPLGKQALANAPQRIDNQYLSQFDSFRKFLQPDDTAAAAEPSESVPDSGQSPQDVLDTAYQQIQAALSDDLLGEIMGQSPSFFEHLVVKLLERMGYGGSLSDAGVVVGQSGDEGIDGIIREDKLGFDMIYIQAKRWDPDKGIGRPEIQKFVGALVGQGAGKGLFITTAQFTREAREYAQKQHTTKVVLVDGQMLAKLMIEYNVGVSTEITYEIKRLDRDFFVDDLD